MKNKQAPAPQDPIVRAYHYRQLEFRYWGRSYFLDSSQALFSAAQIDRGSSLLLKSIQESALLENMVADYWQAQQGGQLSFDIWDWGCGIGVLGTCAQGYLQQIWQRQCKLALREERPAAKLRSTLHCSDRDGLALHFSQHNWQANIPALNDELQQLSLNCLNGIWGEDAVEQALAESQGHPALVLSNIPAKLGNPVLQTVIPQLALSLPQAVVAMVIVSPLRELAEEAIRNAGLELLHFSGSGDHSIFHYRCPAGLASSQAPYFETFSKLYKRNTHNLFRVERRGNSYHVKSQELTKRQGPTGEIAASGRQAKWDLSWSFDSAFGLGDFDSPSFGLSQAVQVLGQRNWGGKLLIWEPGHGHLAQFLLHKPGSQVQQVQLFGRDRLGLLYSDHNISRSLGPDFSSYHQVACPSQILPLYLSHDKQETKSPKPEEKRREKHPLLIFTLDESLNKTQQQLWKETLLQLPSGSWVFLQAKTHILQRLNLSQLSHWALKHELRGHGLLSQLYYVEEALQLSNTESITE